MEGLDAPLGPAAEPTGPRFVELVDVPEDGLFRPLGQLTIEGAETLLRMLEDPPDPTPELIELMRGGD